MRSRTVWTGLALAAVAAFTTAGADDARKTAKPTKGATAKTRAVIEEWPAKAKEAATKTIDTYGEPDEATASMLLWNARGPWKRIVAYRDEVAHAWPMPHSDLVEMFIDYKVPADKVDDLAKFDGSVIVERTKGEISARCEEEGANFLALNLANDIVTGRIGVDAARKQYAEAVKAKMANPAKGPIVMEKLLFEKQISTADPDTTVLPLKAARK
jgi:hypothetical protein